jgi:hypothetical protein
LKLEERQLLGLGLLELALIIATPGCGIYGRSDKRSMARKKLIWTSSPDLIIMMSFLYAWYER